MRKAGNPDGSHVTESSLTKVCRVLAKFNTAQRLLDKTFFLWAGEGGRISGWDATAG
jgi:hypothetical protein